MPEWYDEIDWCAVQPPAKLPNAIDSGDILYPIRVPIPNLKVTLSEPDKTILNLQRRLDGDGDISEEFREEETHEANTRTAGSYQKVLDRTLETLRMYSNSIGSVGTDKRGS